MSRRQGRHVKVAANYSARHAKPPAPGAGALIGTAARAVPASLVIGAAGSAFALSGTASAATAPVSADTTPITGSMANLAMAKAAAARTLMVQSQGRHAAPTKYTVASGDTLSAISSRFCGTSADYPALAVASGITDPNAITPGQPIRLSCHHSVPAGFGAPAPASPAPAAPSAPTQAPAQPTVTAAASTTVGTAGMSAFEACVISRESGGNPQAVNPSSGAGGLFQFLPSTWASLGYASSYPGGAQTAPASVQEAAFSQLYSQSGTSPWGPYDGC